jgi:hypothetical protein
MGVTDASLNIVDEVHHTEQGGKMYPSALVAEVSFMGEGSVTLDLTYQELPLICNNFFDEDTTAGTATSTGGTNYTWSYDGPDDAAVTPQYLGIEFGAPDAEYEACGVLFSELNVSGEAGGVWVGDFPFLCADINTATMSTGTAVDDRAVDLIRMSDTTIYIDTWSGTIGSATIDDTLISFDLSVSNGRHLKLFGGELQPTDWGDTQWSGTLTTVVEFNASGKAIVDELLGPALVQRMIRIEATTGTCPGATCRLARLDFYGTLVNGAELFSDREGNVTVSLEWQGTYNATDSAWFAVDVMNDRTALP